MPNVTKVETLFFSVIFVFSCCVLFHFHLPSPVSFLFPYCAFILWNLPCFGASPFILWFVRSFFFSFLAIWLKLILDLILKNISMGGSMCVHGQYSFRHEKETFKTYWIKDIGSKAAWLEWMVYIRSWRTSIKISYIRLSSCIFVECHWFFCWTWLAWPCCRQRNSWPVVGTHVSSARWHKHFTSGTRHFLYNKTITIQAPGEGEGENTNNRNKSIKHFAHILYTAIYFEFGWCFSYIIYVSNNGNNISHHQSYFCVDCDMTLLMPILLVYSLFCVRLSV